MCHLLVWQSLTSLLIDCSKDDAGSLPMRRAHCLVASVLCIKINLWCIRCVV